MSDFAVSPAELDKAAEAFERLAQRAAEQLRTLQGVQLTQPDFGRVPWLQTRVYEAFEGHTTECEGSLANLEGALGSASGGLTACAENYRGYEEAAVAASQRFFGGVSR